METFRVKTDEGGTRIISTNGTEIVVRTTGSDEDAVIAERVRAMLNQHNRLEALELGHARSYSGYSTRPHVVGSDHIEDREKLLTTAHQAERRAEQWDEYREKVRQALNPPDLAEIDAAPGVERYLTEVRFRRAYPRNAREIPASLRESLMLALSYATVNMEAYLQVASECRREHAERYGGEEAALRDLAARQMADELGED